MNIKNFALVFGILFAVVGLLGLLNIGVTQAPRDPNLAVHMQHGYLFGLFPVNLPHNLFHLAIGVWGLASYNHLYRARVYAKSLAVIYGVLAVMGLFPVLNTFFGLIPLYSHDIWLHAGTAAIAAYFGWATEPARRAAAV